VNSVGSFEVVCVFQLAFSTIIMLKEYSFNTILLLQRAEMCQRRKKGCVYGVQNDLSICRNGRGDSVVAQPNF
jgi:hypothetical protein